MKSNQLYKKVALFASVIAVFAISTANAADTDSTVGNETNIVNDDAAAANPDVLCPNGNPRGTRATDCTVGKNGRHGGKGTFAKGHGGNKGCQGNVSKGRGGKGHVAHGRDGRGASQGRKGMGPGKGLGDGTGLRDGSCVQGTPETAES